MYREAFEGSPYHFDRDGITPVYFRTAYEHELAFRGVLADIKSRSGYASGVDLDQPLGVLLQQCYPTRPQNNFNVADFLVGPRQNSVLLEWLGELGADEVAVAWENEGILSGAGAIYKYATDGEAVTLNAVVEQFRG